MFFKNIFLATTGMSATVFSGYTCHSHQYGFILPVGRKQDFAKFKGEDLKYQQKRLTNLNLLIIDEFSMLKLRYLFFIYKRLKKNQG